MLFLLGHWGGIIALQHSHAPFEAAQETYPEGVFWRHRNVDLQGIQVVKQLRRLDSPLKQDAEIALYLKQFDDAEMLYRRMDRPDLAVDMRMRLGDWFAVSSPIVSLLCRTVQWHMYHVSRA